MYRYIMYCSGGGCRVSRGPPRGQGLLLGTKASNCSLPGDLGRTETRPTPMLQSDQTREAFTEFHIPELLALLVTCVGSLPEAESYQA